ncbi:MAG: PTS sugar transporter subunit IIC, partial [bacterium]
MDGNMILFCLMGGLVVADTEAVGQFMLSQPLIACAIAGMLLGNMVVGLTIGLLFQLPYLMEAPLGGAKVYMVNSGAYVAAGLAIKFNQIFSGQANIILLVTILSGILLSWGMIPLQKWLRQVSQLLQKRADLVAQNGDLGKISCLNYLGVLNAYLFGVLSIALFLMLGTNIGKAIIELVPIQYEAILKFLKPVLLGAGFGTVVLHFVNKSTLQYTLFGA